MTHTKDQMREYMRVYRQQIKDEVIARLGGQCVICGSEDDLQVDHIDPSTKSFSLSRNWTRARKLTEEEMDKCQLLCKDCHIRKSRKEATGYEERRHGTEAMYRTGCRCDECYATHSNNMREYRKRVVG